MQRPYNERWERTKRYLFRNLLVEPRFCLSPVPEESRSVSSDERPYSPLPELIIEREPNRHDESREYYQDLEVRMKRYYRKLFLDGVDSDSMEYEGLINIDEDISEFDINRSMASTFIKDSNNRENNEVNRATTTILNEYNANVEDRVPSNEETHKTVDTESESMQDSHKISTTVAEIHEEKRLAEQKSPVLIPRLRKFGSQLFGALFANKTNILVFNNGDVEINKPEDKSREEETSLNKTDTSKDLEINIEDLDIEVENIMENTESHSISTHDSVNTNQDVRRSGDGGNTTSSVNNEEALVLLDHESHRNTVSTAEKKSEHDEDRASRDEESIGPNEYDYTQQNRTNTSSTEDYAVEADDDSFETAVRRGIFESKNKRKATGQSSNEELTSSSSSNTEECEPIEVMRGTSHSDRFDALRRKSTMSQESPQFQAFAIPSAAESEEDTLHDKENNKSNASAETMNEIQVESCSLERETDQNGLGIHDSTAKSSSNSIDLNEDLQYKTTRVLGTIKESSVDEEEATPTLPANNLVTTLCHDIWSVSPIEIDVAELSPIVQNMAASSRRDELNRDKREAELAIDSEAPEKKKKKYNHIEVQTCTLLELCPRWEDIKADLFVGTPLIFNLCSCQDHICPTTFLTE